MNSLLLYVESKARLSVLQKSKHFQPRTILLAPSAAFPQPWVHGKNQDFFGQFVVKFLLKKICQSQIQSSVEVG